MRTSVFHSVLGDAFDDLPPQLQRIHDLRASKYLTGECRIKRGSNWLANLFAIIASLPTSSAGATLSVTIQRVMHGEVWSRNFDGHSMRSFLQTSNGYLAEQLGPVTLMFALTVSNEKIEWHVSGAKLFSIPLPTAWFIKTRATESVVNNRYAFDVSVVLPLVGLIVSYSGWLVEHE